MNGFERRKERKKNNIIQSAQELFSMHGVQKVTIQEIAKKAQVSQVTIYNYFGGKDELLIETVKAYATNQLEYFRGIVEDSDKNFKDKITSLIHDKHESVMSLDADFLKTIISDQPDINAFIQEYYFKEVMPIFMKLIENGKREGAIHPDLSPQAVMLYIDMYYQGLKNHPEIYQTKGDLERMTHEITHLFFYGLMGNQDESIHKKDDH
ncbi:TetR/AcrR family transcriptional regulator [Thalassobacillus hwangdonensis]|uniref:TetR/AcrR family transcriptional regulator n=1 Tax=Thalassobacillus hwangdonensis TaxID=546108 RepID=A0ABW3KVQ7_9BACI